MRRFLFVSIALAVAVLIACSDDDEGATSTPIVDPDAAPYDRCSTFNGEGSACDITSPDPCFPFCKKGGVFCVDGPSGPIWHEVRDTTCLPDGAPSDEPFPFEEAGVPDAGQDAGGLSDAGDGGDGGGDGGDGG